MAVPELRPRPGKLREVAEKIEQATGLRVQIIGGNLVMSPPRRGKHVGVIHRLRCQIGAAAPGGTRPVVPAGRAAAWDLEHAP